MCHPTVQQSTSWMNLVEVWFGIVERQAIRRGVFKSAKDLNTKIRTFIDAAAATTSSPSTPGRCFGLATAFNELKPAI